MYICCGSSWQPETEIWSLPRCDAEGAKVWKDHIASIFNDQAATERECTATFRNVGNYTPNDTAAHPSTPEPCAMHTVHKLFAQNRSSSVCVWTSCSVAEHSCVSVQWRCTKCSHVSVMFHVLSKYCKVQFVSVYCIRAHSRNDTLPTLHKTGCLNITWFVITGAQ